MSNQDLLRAAWDRSTQMAEQLGRLEAQVEMLAAVVLAAVDSPGLRRVPEEVRELLRRQAGDALQALPDADGVRDADAVRQRELQWGRDRVRHAEERAETTRQKALQQRRMRRLRKEHEELFRPAPPAEEAGR